MTNEQLDRFSAMRQLVQEADAALVHLSDITNSKLNQVDNDSSSQGDQLQRIQQSAGTAVQALTQVADIARHARSFQAQAHSRNSNDTPH